MRKQETKRKEEREKKIAAKNNKVDKMRKRKEERERESPAQKRCQAEEIVGALSLHFVS